MTSQVSSVRVHRLSIAPLMALALLVRLLVPAGWMPSTSEDGWVRISLCTGEGAKTIWVDRGNRDHGAEQDAPDKALLHCPFAGLAAFWTVEPEAEILARPIVPVSPAPLYFGVIAIGRGLVAPPPPARGPPILN